MNPLNPNGEARQMRPTNSHRAAIWECMLGTVYAANQDGEVRYFDYDYRAALRFAGLNTKRLRDKADLRIYRASFRANGCGPFRFRTGVQGPEGPRSRQLVLWRR